MNNVIKSISIMNLVLVVFLFLLEENSYADRHGGGGHGGGGASHSSESHMSSPAFHPSFHSNESSFYPAHSFHQAPLFHSVSHPGFHRALPNNVSHIHSFHLTNTPAHVIQHQHMVTPAIVSHHPFTFTKTLSHVNAHSNWMMQNNHNQYNHNYNQFNNWGEWHNYHNGYYGYNGYNGWYNGFGFFLPALLFSSFIYPYGPFGYYPYDSFYSDPYFYNDSYDYNDNYSSYVDVGPSYSGYQQNQVTGTIASSTPTEKWISAKDGEVPDNAIVSGNANNTETYYCRAKFHGKMYYGTLIPDDACYIQEESVTLQFTSYEVLVSLTS